MRLSFIIIFLIIFVPQLGMSQALKIDTSARPRIFETSFLNDTSYLDPLNPYKFYKVELGKIKIESGKIIVCDPVEMHIGDAFIQKFPRGEFPVQLSLMQDGDSTSRIVAYCRIKFSDEPVKKWTVALKPGETEANKPAFNPFYYAGIGVGVGVLIDEFSKQNFIKKPHYEWGNLFVNKLDSLEKQGFVYEFNRHSLAAYKGFDGATFKVYIGYDNRDRICRLLVDGGMYNIPVTQF